jgi:predicted DNA-binding WGR domain protein
MGSPLTFEKIVERWRIFLVTVIRPDLSQAIDTVRLICVDTARNSNKQWIGWVMPNGDLYVEYGRVGYAQKPHVYDCRSVRAAQTKLSHLILEKQGKGYQQVVVEEASTALDFSTLEQSEAKMIQGRLERLQQRAEVVGQYANITFDVNRGVFSTQMGVISLLAIARGRQALQRVENSLSGSRNGDRGFTAAVEDYLAVIPLKVGMTLDPYQILGTRQQVQGQSRLLDELALALSEVGEIRDWIRNTVGVAVLGGSDERARWLQWGQNQEDGAEVPTSCDTGDPLRVSRRARANWSRWR